MTGLDEFRAVFGDISVLSLIEIILSAVFLYGIYMKVKKYIDNRYEEESDRKEKEEKRDEQLKIAIDSINKYPEYRAQSIRIQKELEQKIKELKDSQEINTKRLEEIEESNKLRDRNRLRDILLRYYRHYADEEKNPNRSWPIMEKNAFDELFKEYENAGGNGYMHTVVKPAMDALDVVDM